MISIGAVYQGPELQGSAISHTIMAASKALREFRGALVKGHTPWVNAVFVVPGSLAPVDFEGLQFGDYSKRDKGVVVKIAVPEEALEEGQLENFVVNALRGANAMAFEFFREKGDAFPLRDADEMVAEISRKLGS